MKTLNDYLDAGYRLDGGKSYTKGYVSRKVDLGNQIVYEAGGNRKGQFYILAPSYTSTRYCFRHYLTKPEGGNK